MKNQRTEQSIQFDYFICLLALDIMSIYYYGWRALIVTLISVGVCYATDLLCIYFRKKPYNFKDISAIVTGMTFALLMPASITYSVLAVSCVIMIVIGKQAFGGNDNPVFATVAVGYAFASLCWKSAFLLYPAPVPFGQLDLASSVSDKLAPSLFSSLETASVPSLSNFDMLLGRFTGPMGSTHIIIILVCALILMFRKLISSLVFTSGLATILAAAYIFPLEIRESRSSSLLFELISGATVFVMLFVASDTKLTPKTKFGRLLYGIIIGLLTILFKRYAHLEVGIIFAILIANALSTPLDNNTTNISNGLKKLFSKMKLWPGYILRFIVFIFKSILKGIVRFFKFVKGSITREYLISKEKSRLKKEMVITPSEINLDETEDEIPDIADTEVKDENADEYAGTLLLVKSSRKMKRKFVSIETLKKEVAEQGEPQKPAKEKKTKKQRDENRRSLISLIKNYLFKRTSNLEDAPTDLDIIEQYEEKERKSMEAASQQKSVKKKTSKRKSSKAVAKENLVAGNKDDTSDNSEIQNNTENEKELEYSSGGEHN